MVGEMNKYIYRLIQEQFNVDDIDFRNNQQEYDNNIFFKEPVNPFEVYDKIMNNEDIQRHEIEFLNGCVSVVKVDINGLQKVVRFYDKFYPNDSMNWLDVSDIRYMSRLFEKTRYNGDISKWDVSNVKFMEWMFQNSQFNGDISQWNVSNVISTAYMFQSSQFSQNISNWDMPAIKRFKRMFDMCPIPNDYKPKPMQA